MSISEGTEVTWAWGSAEAFGTVVTIYRSTITRTLAGAQVTRNGSTDDPAYLIEQDDGARVLKLSSEVERA